MKQIQQCVFKVTLILAGFGVFGGGLYAQIVALPNSCFESTAVGWTAIDGGNGAGSIIGTNRSKSQCSPSDANYLKWVGLAGSSLRNPSRTYYGPGDYEIGAYVKVPSGDVGNTLNFRLIVNENGSFVQVRNSDTIQPQNYWGSGINRYFIDTISLTHACAGSCIMHAQFRANDAGDYHIDSVSLRQVSPVANTVSLNNPCFESNTNGWNLLGGGTKTVLGDSKSRCSSIDYNYGEWDAFQNSIIETAGLAYLGPGTYTAGSYRQLPSSSVGSTFNYSLVVRDNGTVVETVNSAAITGPNSWAYLTIPVMLTHNCAGTCTIDMRLIANQTATFNLDSISLEKNPVLPVSLTGWYARPVDGTVLLNWETVTEEGNKGFFIERKSMDDTDFNSIGWVDAEGEASSYRFTDTNARPGNRYSYRLRMVDLNGNMHFSAVVEITLAKTAKEPFVLFPNPASSVLHIHLAKNGVLSAMQLRDSQGRKVPLSLMPAGSYVLHLNLDGLAPGVYFLNGIFEGKSYIKPFVVKR